MFRIIQLVLVFVGITLFSCVDTPKESSKRVFRYAQINPITSLDPAFARSQNNIWAVEHVFNTLVKLDKNMSITPSLAKSWEILDSGTIYRFHLRTDVYFHESPCFRSLKTRKFIAPDIVYSFYRITDEEIASPGSWVFKDRVIENSPFKALNDSTFEIRLKSPFAPFLGTLTMAYCSVIPHEAVEHFGKDFRIHPVGTGAFSMKFWDETESLVLQKHTNYWDKKINIDGIRVKFYPDRRMAWYDLILGRLDYIAGTESTLATELIGNDGKLRNKFSQDAQFYRAPYLNSEYLGINLELAKKTGSPLSDVRVRQALNYAIDRKQMLQVMRRGIGKPASFGFCPPSLYESQKDLQANVKGYEFNLQKAKSLIKTIIPEKLEKPIILHCNPDYQDLCHFLVAQWEDLGLNIKVEVIESATLREMMVQGKTLFFRASWIADYPDPESFLGVFYGKNPAPPNYTRFKNPNFDELYRSANNLSASSQRQLIYLEMEKILISESPVIFLFYDESMVLASKKLKNWQPNAMGTIPVDDLSF
jgi:oligopeptide transport system substrate-binding protein